MDSSILSIRFKIWSFLGCDIFTVKVHNNKTATIFNEAISGRSILPSKVELSKDETSKFVSELENCGVFKWKRHYRPELPVLDGTSWSVEIERSGKRRFIRDGDNEFPPMWNAFCRLFGIGTNKLRSVLLTLHRTNQVILPPQGDDKLNSLILEYKESIEIDADSEKLIIRQEYGKGCIVTKEYYVQPGIEELLEQLEIPGGDEGWLDEAPYEDTTGKAFYTLDIATYGGAITKHQGLYDCKHLPQKWTDVMEAIYEFIGFYGNTDLLDIEAFTDIEKIFYSVAVKDIDKTYYYFSDDKTLKVGDKVIVPFGKHNDVRLGEIMKIEQFTPKELTFTPDKMKKIIKKVSEEEFADGKLKI